MWFKKLRKISFICSSATVLSAVFGFNSAQASSVWIEGNGFSASWLSQKKETVEVGEVEKKTEKFSLLNVLPKENLALKFQTGYLALSAQPFSTLPTFDLAFSNTYAFHRAKNKEETEDFRYLVGLQLGFNSLQGLKQSSSLSSKFGLVLELSQKFENTEIGFKSICSLKNTNTKFTSKDSIGPTEVENTTESKLKESGCDASLQGWLKLQEDAFLGIGFGYVFSGGEGTDVSENLSVKSNTKLSVFSLEVLKFKYLVH